MDLAEEKINSVPTVANSIYILKTAHLTHKGVFGRAGDGQEVWPVLGGPIFLFKVHYKATQYVPGC